MTSLKKSSISDGCCYNNIQSQRQPSRSAHPSVSIKIIIQSLTVQSNASGSTKIPFEALIQGANDSASFDTSLEFKSLPLSRQDRAPTSVATNATSFHKTVHGFEYMEELRQRLNKNIGTNAKDLPSKTPLVDKKNLIDAMPKTTCQKFKNTTNVTAKRLPKCSTPFRLKRPSQLDLQTPPADARFIDSENESVDGENALMDVSTTTVESADDDDAQNQTLVKCFSLTPDSCRQLSTRIAGSRTTTSVPNSPKHKRGGNSMSSFRVNRSSIVSPLEESPLRRQRNVKIKNSSFFNLFRSTPVVSKSSTENPNLSETCTKLRQLLANAEDSDDTELGCAPLLARENVNQLSREKTMDWSENLEFSFICEPSHSDADIDDDDDKDDQKSIYVSRESVNTDPHVRSIPIVKVKPVATKYQQNHHIRTTTQNSLSPFRRSMSDPTLRGMVFTTANVNSGSDLNSVAATQIQMHAIRVSTVAFTRHTIIIKTESFDSWRGESEKK